MTIPGPLELARRPRPGQRRSASHTAEPAHTHDRQKQRVFGETSFFGKSSLPVEPQAREHEKRGRRWLALSYLLCPCHLPVTLALLGAAFGGTVFGAAVTGNVLRVGLVMSVGYGLVLWRGLRQIRRAKRIEAAGHRLRCTPDGCAVTSATPSGP